MSKRSDAIVKGRDRAAARAMLRATGMDDANFEGPMIAVFNTWTNMGPCNMDLDKPVSYTHLTLPTICSV